MNTKVDYVVDIKDFLVELMEAQDYLNSKVGISQEDAIKFDEEKLKKWLINYNSALVCEAGELWKCFGRWWRKDVENWKDEAKEEAIDMLHFLMSIFLILGMDAKEVHDIYMKKNAKNLNRPEDNWTYKTPADSSK